LEHERQEDRAGEKHEADHEKNSAGDGEVAFFEKAQIDDGELGMPFPDDGRDDRDNGDDAEPGDPGGVEPVFALTFIKDDLERA